jgi:hypothetical protein
MKGGKGVASRRFILFNNIGLITAARYSFPPFLSFNNPAVIPSASEESLPAISAQVFLAPTEILLNEKPLIKNVVITSTSERSYQTIHKSIKNGFL